MITRREFTKLVGLSTGALLIEPLQNLSRLLAAEGFENEHLIFSPEQIPVIRKKLTLPIFKDFWDETLNADLISDMKFLEKEIVLNNQSRHLARANKILQREAFVYVITGDKKRGQMARLAVQKILQFKKWDYFQEAGKYTIGLQRSSLTTQSLVLTYEWIFDILSEYERKEIIRQLPDKGCEPCYRSLYGMLHPDEVVGWGFDPESSFFEERDMRNWPRILARTNLRAVPMSALGLGAIFLGDKNPRTKEWMKVVKQTYLDFVTLFSKDGSYPEGTSYCNYTSQELILFLNVLKRKTGKDWSDAVNWQGVMDFFTITRMPSDVHPEGHVNFGDSGSGFVSDVAFWVARRFKDGKAQYAATHFPRNHRIFSPVIYDRNVKEEKPPKNWQYRHFDIGWVIVTTGAEKDDFLVALRSGPPANHEHADRNSVILKSKSENLLVDNWHPPYDHKHAAWALRTSPAHNTVLIDGKGHQYHDGKEGTNASLAAAKVVFEKKTDNYAIVTSDATQAYNLANSDVGKVARSMVVFPDSQVLIVVDSLEMKQNAAEFRARWFVENEDKKAGIKISGDWFEFNRPGADLIGICAGSGGVKLEKANFPVPEDYGIFPFVDVVAAEKGKQVHLVSVMAVCEKDGERPDLSIEETKNGWKIKTKNFGIQQVVSMTVSGAKHEFIVE